MSSSLSLTDSPSLCFVLPLGQTTIRVLELKRGNERRNIVQLHFKDWPDFGVPSSTEPIRNLVRIMDFYRGRARVAGIKGPVVIHCSAGIGRTGTYLAIVFALNAIKHLKQLEAANSTTTTPDSATTDAASKEAFNSESPSYSEDEAYEQKNGSSQVSTTSPSPSPSPSPYSVASPSDVTSPTASSAVPNSQASNGSSINPNPNFSPTSQHSPSAALSTAGPSIQTVTGRNTLTRSTDSVEYETSLILDTDDDIDGDYDYDDEDLEEEENDSDDEQDMMHIRAFQRPGSVIPVDIMKIVLSLRKQRNRGMVQTEDQYKFIYRVVLDEIIQQRINVGDAVLQFMKDAASDFTDSTPTSARLSSKRRSQPRSPRSTQVSLGSSVSIGASGLSKLSSSTVSSIHSASSYSDDESDRKSRTLRASGDNNNTPLLTLEVASEVLVFQPKRNLAMSSADIMPLTESSLNPSITPSPLLSHSASQVHDHHGMHHSTHTSSASSSNRAEQNGVKQEIDTFPSPRSPGNRHSSPPGTTTFKTDI